MMSVTSEHLIKWSTAASGSTFGPTFATSRDADVEFTSRQTTYNELTQMLQGASAIFPRLDIFDVDEFIEESLEEEDVTEAVDTLARSEGSDLNGRPYRLTVLWLMGGVLLRWRALTDEYTDFKVEVEDIIHTENLSTEDQVEFGARIVLKSEEYRRATSRHRSTVAREVLVSFGGIPDALVGDIVRSAGNTSIDVILDIETKIYRDIGAIVAEIVSSTGWATATNQEKRRDIAAQAIAERYDGWAVGNSALDTLVRAARAV